MSLILLLRGGIAPAGSTADRTGLPTWVVLDKEVTYVTGPVDSTYLSDTDDTHTYLTGPAELTTALER